MNIGSRGRRQAWWRKSPAQPNSFVVRHDPSIAFTTAIPPSFCSLHHGWAVLPMRCKGEGNQVISKRSYPFQLKLVLYEELETVCMVRNVYPQNSSACKRPLFTSISISNIYCYKHTERQTMLQLLDVMFQKLNFLHINNLHLIFTLLLSVNGVFISTYMSFIRNTVWLHVDALKEMKLYIKSQFHSSCIMGILHKGLHIFTQRWKQCTAKEEKNNAIIHHLITCYVPVPDCLFSAEGLFVLK